jgi:hypothetical protein
LSTKYYTAALEISPFEIDSKATSLPQPAAEILASAVANQGEGIILIMPPSQTPSPTTACPNDHGEVEGLSKTLLLQIGKEAAEIDAFAMKLLVQLIGDGFPMASKVTEESTLWAVDHGFEYVEVDESHLVQGWQEREKDGLPRLMEAIQSTMWTCLKKKNIHAVHVQEQASSSSSDKGENVFQFGEASTKTTVAVERDAARRQIALEALDNATTGSVRPTNVASTSGEVGHENVGEDHDVEDFSDIMEKAKRLRDEATAGNMSDDERRRKAAEMALQLAKMMNLDDDDYDDDE